MAQESWRDKTIVKLFKSKANFRRERDSCRSFYNGRAAFMKFKKLNAVTVKGVWNKLSETEKLHWSEVARSLNLETDDYRTWKFHLWIYILSGRPLSRITVKKTSNFT